MSNRNPFLTTFRIAALTVATLSLMFIFTSSALANEPAALLERPTRLVIPAITLDAPVIPVGWKPVIVNGNIYGQWEAADNNVGWHNLSASPGHAGNTVLSGHSNINARVFRNLQDVNIGDEITLVSAADSRPYRYKVTQKFLIQEKGVTLETRIKNAQWIAPTQDERLTLITCAQPGATHRLVVIARPAPLVKSLDRPGWAQLKSYL